MSVTRTVISEAPDGSRVVFHQRQLPDGRFHNQSAERHTDPMSAPTATSGSQHDHAPCSASGSKQWLSCTASIAYAGQNADRIFAQDVQSVIRLTPYLKSLPPEEVFPHEGRAVRWVKDYQAGRELTEDQKKDIRRSEGNEYSREGTRAHEFATQIFNGEKTLEDIPEDFRPHVGYYVDFCMALRKDDAEEFLTETKVPYFYDPSTTGTRDFAIVRDGHVIIADYKHGAGDLIDAVENTQCAIYGLSTIEDLIANEMYPDDPDTIVEIWIIQPRHHADRPAKDWKITLADLRAFCADIQAKYDLIDGAFKAFAEMPEGTEFRYEELGLEFVPSDSACKYCKCKSFCPARAAAMTDMLTGPDFRGIDLLAGLPDIEDLPGDKITKKAFNEKPPEEKVNARLGDKAPLPDDILVAVRLNASAIIEWLGDVKEFVDGRVLAGEKLDGLKIVMGNPGDRAWVDEEVAAKLLGNRLPVSEKYVKKLLSPAKAEKLIDLKKETPRFRNLWNAAVTRAPGRPVVVPANDKREPVAALADGLPDIEDLLDQEYADALGADM